MQSHHCPPGPVPSCGPRRQAPNQRHPPPPLRPGPCRAGSAETGHGALAPMPPLISQLRPPEARARRGPGWGGRAHRCRRRPEGRAATLALVRRARRSPTSSKFNRYLNPKGNEQTSGIGCQGIFSFVGRIYPQVFPQQVISGPEAQVSLCGRGGHQTGSRPAAPGSGDSWPRSGGDAAQAGDTVGVPEGQEGLVRVECSQRPLPKSVS